MPCSNSKCFRASRETYYAAKSVELDPLDLMTNFRVVQANYYARRYDEAVRTGRIDRTDARFTLHIFLSGLVLGGDRLNSEAYGTSASMNDNRNSRTASLRSTTGVWANRRSRPTSPFSEVQSLKSRRRSPCSNRRIVHCAFFCVRSHSWPSSEVCSWSLRKGRWWCASS